MKKIVLVISILLFMISGCNKQDSISDDELFLAFKQINAVDAMMKNSSVYVGANEIGKDSYSVYNDSISSQYTTYDETGKISTMEVNVKDYVYGYDVKDNFYTNINLTGTVNKHEDLFDSYLNRYELERIDKSGINYIVVTKVKDEFKKQYVDKYNLGNDVDRIETTFILDKETYVILYRTDIAYYTGEDKEPLTLGEYEYRYDEDNLDGEIRSTVDEHHDKAVAYRMIQVISDPGTTVEQFATFKAPVGDKVELLMKEGYKIDMEKSTANDEKNSNDLTYYVVNDANANLIIQKEDPKSSAENDASGFVLLGDYIPDAILEIRYYTTYNFVGARIDGYEEPVALLTKEAAEALKKVSDELAGKGYRLKIYDAYRPTTAVAHFVRWSKDVKDAKMKEYFYPDLDKAVLFEQKYIMEKSGHSRGSTVDLTLFDMKTEKEVDMGGTFDFLGEASHPDYKDVTTEQYANRMLLRETMLKYGFTPVDEEWWHFTLADEPYPDTYFSFPVNSSVVKGE